MIFIWGVRLLAGLGGWELWQSLRGGGDRSPYPSMIAGAAVMYLVMTRGRR